MFVFGAKFGTIAKSENDMRDMHKVFFSFYQKNCHRSRVKKSCWSHLNCLFLKVAKKVVGFFFKCQTSQGAMLKIGSMLRS